MFRKLRSNPHRRLSDAGSDEENGERHELNLVDESMENLDHGEEDSFIGGSDTHGSFRWDGDDRGHSSESKRVTAAERRRRERQALDKKVMESIPKWKRIALGVGTVCILLGIFVGVSIYNSLDNTEPIPPPPRDSVIVSSSTVAAALTSKLAVTSTAVPPPVVSSASQAPSPFSTAVASTATSSWIPPAATPTTGAPVTSTAAAVASSLSSSVSSSVFSEAPVASSSVSTSVVSSSSEVPAEQSPTASVTSTAASETTVAASSSSTVVPPVASSSASEGVHPSSSVHDEGSVTNGPASSATTVVPPAASSSTSEGVHPSSSVPHEEGSATTAPSSSSVADVPSSSASTSASSTAAPSTSVPLSGNVTLLGDVVKSASDPRQFRLARLSSGMPVLLVSDPRTRSAAAAVSVNAGSFNDPVGTPGLAHFVEHLLFMGTQKYPVTDDYDRFIAQNGGTMNAYTEDEATTYFFQVNADALPGALDRLAQFFISPISFRDETVSKERSAVASEHAKNKSNTLRRLYQLYKSLADPSSPFSRFGTGDDATLSAPDILDTLKQFYDANYVPEKLSTVVIGPQSLDDLQAAAVASFAGLKDRPKQYVPPNTSTAAPVTGAEAPSVASTQGAPTSSAVQTSSQAPPVVPSGARRDAIGARDAEALVGVPFVSLGKVLRADVVGSDTLMVAWPVPITSANHDSHVLGYMEYFLGHESVGSALYWLRDQRLATAMYAFSEEFATFSNIYAVVTLTNDGLARWKEVAGVVVRYARHAVASHGVRFAEYAQVRSIPSVYPSSQRPGDACLSLAGNLRRTVDPKSVLDGPTSVVHNNATFDVLVQSINDDASVAIFLGSSSFPVTDLPLTEQWYGTHYAVADFDAELFGHLAGTGTNDPVVSLPLENPFVLGPLKLVDVPENATSEPKEVVHAPFLHGWHAIDPLFREPYASINVFLGSYTVPASARNRALADFAATLTTTLTNSDMYYASTVGVNGGVRAHAGGIEITVSGLDAAACANVVRMLAGQLATACSATYVGTQPYVTANQTLWQGYTDATLDSAYVQAVSFAREIVYGHHTPAELLQQLSSAGPAEFASFCDGFKQSVHVIGLAYGNVAADDAVSLFNAVRGFFGSEGASPKAFAQDVARVNGARLVYRAPSTIAGDPNSAVVAYYEHGPMNASALSWAASRARLGLVSAMLAQRAFDELRTKQQLGYIVFMRDMVAYSVGGVALAVQSGTRDPEAVSAAIDSFASSASSFVSTMTDDAFSTWIAARIDSLTAGEETLTDAAARRWSELVNMEPFDVRDGEIASLRALSRAEFATYVAGLFEHRLSVRIYGSGSTVPTGESADGSEVIADAAAYFETAQKYSFEDPRGR